MSRKSTRFESRKGKEMRWVAKDHYSKRRRKIKLQKIARRKQREKKQ